MPLRREAGDDSGRYLPGRFRKELVVMKRFLLGAVMLAAISLAVTTFWAAGAFAVDVSKGEFYTEEEYQKLSKKEREAYCEALARESERQKSMLEEAQSQLEKERALIDDLKARIRKVDSELEPLRAEIGRLQDEISRFQALPKEWTVQKGECLYKISGYEQIYNDPLKWPRIYRANRDKIEDPELIYVGQVLTIPRDWPRTHTVREGEYLAKIAGYWEIYDDWRQWTRIYEANKDKIKDPDLIYPDMVLTIPR